MKSFARVNYSTNIKCAKCHQMPLDVLNVKKFSIYKLYNFIFGTVWA